MKTVLGNKTAILIAGPTASGKSALALDVAVAIGGRVINADAMAVYSQLSILTARPGPEAQGAAPHRLYGIVSGAEHFSVGTWLARAEAELVACVSLLYYSETLAEVRSLAVADKVKGQGWGSGIVKAIIAQARHKQVPTLFALTRAVPFFQKVGFTISSKELFPEKVWRDCQICPLLHNCDETAVVLHLTPKPQPTNYPITQLPNIFMTAV